VWSKSSAQKLNTYMETWPLQESFLEVEVEVKVEETCFGKKKKKGLKDPLPFRQPVNTSP